ncbi:MAG: 5-formyltetrahydrofolate cyclo-ligase [Pseudomonadales bacterium]
MKASELRHVLCQQRKQLPCHTRQLASARASARAASLPTYRHAQHIGVYYACNGELNPQTLIQHAWHSGKNIYLPVLCGETLRFAAYNRASPMRPNRFGIPEPACSSLHLLDPIQLDLVFAPLVAFDAQGNRLGMGGGYYDKSFAFRPEQNASGPILMGLAYDFQRQVKLAAQTWDVPLDGIVTESRHYQA